MEVWTQYCLLEDLEEAWVVDVHMGWYVHGAYVRELGDSCDGEESFSGERGFCVPGCRRSLMSTTPIDAVVKWDSDVRMRRKCEMAEGESEREENILVSRQHQNRKEGMEKFGWGHPSYTCGSFLEVPMW